MSRKQLEECVIDRILCDMIACFELSKEELCDTLENIASVSTSDLMKYLED